MINLNIDLMVGDLMKARVYLVLLASIMSCQLQSQSQSQQIELWGRLELRHSAPDESVIIGVDAGRDASPSASRANVMIGLQSGQTTDESFFNCFVGALSGLNNTTGSSNTFLGTTAGDLNTQGDRNTYIGKGAGGLFSTGNDNICLGTDAGPATVANGTLNERLYIDVKGSNFPLIVVTGP